MKFHAVFTCEAGHKQELTYGPGFDRVWVERHCALMFGGHIEQLGRDVPGFPCAYETEAGGEPCGKKVSFEISEVAEEVS